LFAALASIWGAAFAMVVVVILSATKWETGTAARPPPRIRYSRAGASFPARRQRVHQRLALGEIGIPFYLLIGFAIENGLKGFLKHRQDARGNWRKSHDLSLLLSHCRENGLRVNEAVDRLIHLISRYHAEFWFRHPEKAGTADVFDAHSTIFLTDALLRQAFEQTNTSWRHWPKMPPPQSNILRGCRAGYPYST
jgi:hypothetical protein